jgi:Zn-dependent peptidase ImmA (M78 family)
MAVSKSALRAARHAATMLVKEFLIKEPQEIVLENIAMAKGIVVLDAPIEGAESRLVRKGSHGVIRVRASLQDPGRRRFTIAHEIGHWQLHRGLSPLSLCTADDISSGAGGDHEIEANAFAGSLLMPTQLIKALCWEATPSLEIICQIAQTFRTSVTAAAVRFVEECRQTCIAAFSENRKIHWWRARDYEQVWIPPGQQIDPRSNAWDALSRTEMEQVDLDVWFPEWNRDEAQEVCEQSMVLGHRGTVLTLLWLVDAFEEPD